MAETLARTRAFLARSWPLDMLPEVEACEREVAAALDALSKQNENITAAAAAAQRWIAATLELGAADISEAEAEAIAFRFRRGA